MFVSDGDDDDEEGRKHDELLKVCLTNTKMRIAK